MLLSLLPDPSVIAVIVVSLATINVSSSFAMETQLRNQNAQC